MNASVKVTQKRGLAFFFLLNLNYGFTLILPTIFITPVFLFPFLVLSVSSRLASELLHSQKEVGLAPPYQWTLTKCSMQQKKPASPK